MLNTKKKKIILFSLIGFVILLIIGVISLFLLGKDELPTNDKGLWLSNLNIFEQENLFYCLSEASDKINLSEDESIRDYYEGNIESTTLFLEKNKEFFNYFDKCLSFNTFQDPAYINIEDFWIGSILYSRPEITWSAKLVLINARHLFRQGEEEQAFNEAFKVVKIGHIMENSQGPLIQYLVSLSVKEMGLRQLREMLPDAKLSSALLRSYAESLDEFKDSREGLTKGIKAECMSMMNTKIKFLDGIATEEELEYLGINNEINNIKRYIPYFYKPNKTQRIMTNFFRIMITNTTVDYFKDVQSEYSALNLDEIKIPTSKIRMLFTENIMGRFFLNTSLVAFPGSRKKRFLENFSVIGTQTLFAIKSHWQDNHVMPSSLEELVPEYLKEVPLDPFDAQPIRYSPEKAIIYSVGDDLIDNGGIPEDYMKIIEPTLIIGFGQ